MHDICVKLKYHCIFGAPCCIVTGEMYSSTRFSLSLAEILVLAGTTGAGRMAPPASIRISAIYWDHSVLRPREYCAPQRRTSSASESSVSVTTEECPATAGAVCGRWSLASHSCLSASRSALCSGGRPVSFHPRVVCTLASRNALRNSTVCM